MSRRTSLIITIFLCAATAYGVISGHEAVWSCGLALIVLSLLWALRPSIPRMPPAYPELAEKLERLIRERCNNDAAGVLYVNKKEKLLLTFMFMRGSLGRRGYIVTTEDVTQLRDIESTVRGKPVVRVAYVVTPGSPYVAKSVLADRWATVDKHGELQFSHHAQPKFRRTNRVFEQEFATGTITADEQELRSLISHIESSVPA